MKLIARHESQDLASVEAFATKAKSRAKTLTFVETENGSSICGGYLDVTWSDGGCADDPGRRSFIFTLKNHLGVPPTKFAQKVSEQAAYMWSCHCICFGRCEGFVIGQTDGTLQSGLTYEAPRQGVALFDGDGRGTFRANRWELWEVL
jgi:hypothetical protein